jgi:hypothetical protein
MTALDLVLSMLPAGHSLVVRHVGDAVRVSVTDRVDFDDIYYRPHRTLEADGDSAEDAAGKLLDVRVPALVG